MKIVGIKDFVFYFRQCPFCHSWITLDADLPLPASIELHEDHLLLTIFDKRQKEDRTYKISYTDNTITGSVPFVLPDILSTIRRLYSSDYKDSLKIEARCYGCSNFRYWSQNMIFNKRSKKLTNIRLAGERAQFHEISANNERTSYIIHNDYRNRISNVLVVRNGIKQTATIKFIPFHQIDFQNPEHTIIRIKKSLLLT